MSLDARFLIQLGYWRESKADAATMTDNTCILGVELAWTKKPLNAS